MRAWNQRPEEVRYLLNSAFCGRILYAMITEYQKKTSRALPFPLIYLVLPLVLPKQIREKISSRTQLINWVQTNQELVYNFGKRTKDLVSITNEALELMIQTGLIRLTDMGEIEKEIKIKVLSKTKYTDYEVTDCLKKAEHVARWFATAGKVETIYFCLGVRP